MKKKSERWNSPTIQHWLNASISIIWKAFLLAINNIDINISTQKVSQDSLLPIEQINKEQPKQENKSRIKQTMKSHLYKN
jgi:hypothetical protein